ncbi:MAG TPA: response regulator transcription factor [Actinomycetota bacterium]|nr:response regulator transcription factor [Actinomycetota bacterium]
MAPIVLLTDRSPEEVLPASAGLVLDLKTEHLSAAAVGDALLLGPQVVLVDAAENPGQGHAVLRALRERQPRTPVLVVVERRDLERFHWEELADDLLYPGAPEAEIRLRLAMARRRSGGGEGSTVRLGPIALDVDGYRATVDGRPFDLTFKEFELLRFLAERPGRVFTRPALMREVWGYDFYGGTRTVDVHVRRLRAKLGPEHEGLIETVRGVGYRAADV